MHNQTEYLTLLFFTSSETLHRYRDDYFYNAMDPRYECQFSIILYVTYLSRIFKTFNSFFKQKVNTKTFCFVFSINYQYSARNREKNSKVALGIVLVMSAGVAMRLMWIW